MLFIQRIFAHPTLAQIPRPAIVVFMLILGTMFPDIPLKASITLMALAFVQNADYSLQSRAGNRTSNLYHFIAAVFSKLVFFVTLSFLVHIQVTLNVLLTYILGTMLGSVYGTRLSIVIEKMLGAVADLGEEVKGQALPLSRAMLGLTILLVLELAAIGYYGVQYDLYMLAIIALAAYVSDLLFAILRVALNTDAYWFHLSFAVIQAAAGFAVFSVLVKMNGDWFLFAPYLTGAVLGSLMGAEAGKRFGKHLKASLNAQDLKKNVVPLPIKQGIACALLLVPHLLYFGLGSLAQQLLILGAALLQTSAFTVISRARQRNHELYIEWASIFSNGIWFVTFNILVVNELAGYLLIPFLVGTGIGSLWGQAFAMSIEKQIGAFVNTEEKK